MPEIDPSEAPELTSSPQPMRRRPRWHAALRGAGLLLAATGTFFTIVWASLPRLSGATRSARLKFSERQCQIDEAIQNADCCSLAATPDEMPRALSDSDLARDHPER